MNYILLSILISLCSGDDAFHCTFQYGDCDISQQSNDQFDWTWTNTGTNNQESGPGEGHVVPGLLYADSSSSGSIAKFNTGALGIDGPACVEFYYYLYGSNVPADALKVFLRNDQESGIELYRTWSAGGNQGQQWIRRRETIYALSAGIAVGWHAQSGGSNSIVAVDSIRITPDVCGEFSIPLPHYCDFEEESICDMVYSADGNFNWTRHIGQTDTINTGPDEAQGGSYYMFIESSSPRVLGDYAILETPPIEASGRVCVEFAANLHGSSIGELSVWTSNNTKTSWFSIRGNQGNEWLYNQVDVILQNGEKVQFRGDRGESYLGDLAIDSLAITEGVCSEGVYSCTFDRDEDDICDMIQLESDQFNWKWVSYSTPGEETGPQWAHSSPGYIFTESAFHPSGDVARISTPALGHTGDICVDFWYHLYGADIPDDALKLSSVDTAAGGSEVVLWTKGGNRGQLWQNHKQTITNINRHVGIIFTGKVGGRRSEIALDSITIEKERCADPPVDIPFNCDFEDTDLCGMAQSEDDDFDWTWTTQPTPTSNTGPDSARSGNGYVFMESSQPRATGDKSMLMTPILNYNDTVCVKFYSHMHGTSVGHLSLESSNKTDPWKIWSGDRGNQWVWNQESVTLNGHEKIIFKGIIGDGFHGDIGLDHLSIVPGACTEELVTCNFDKGEDDYCTLIQQWDDEFDWTWNSLSTPQDDTGPSAALSSPGYLYTSTGTPRVTGDRAKLTTGALGHNGAVCVEFYYYMYGNDMDESDALTLSMCYTSGCGESEPIWSLGGDQGEGWKQFRTTVTGFSTQYGIGWVAKIGGVNSQVAIDSVTIVKDECSDEAVTLPYLCDFEGSTICGMVQSSADVFNWTRQAGPTPTSNTGPESAQHDDYYMFIESSSPRSPGDFALLKTPKLDVSGPVCIEFYAHMTGDSVGALTITSTNGTANLLKLTGVQGSTWAQQSINADLVEEERVSFRGATGNGYHGDIAIDNLSIQPGSCDNTNFLFSCNFDAREDDMCTLAQQENDQFDWTWISYATPSDVTGPTAGHTPNGYMFTNSASPRIPGYLAKVNTEPLNYDGSVCVEFWYYLYGQDLGTNVLEMYVKDEDGNEISKWRKSGDQGQVWIKYKDSIRGIFRESSIGWVARVDGTASQVAIDSINIVKNECEEIPVELPFNCDFEENTLCGMSQSEVDDFHWTRTTGETPTSNTGPTSAQHGSYYMFIESSNPRQANQDAIFRTPVLDHTGSACVTFYTHMYGTSVGSVVVQSTNRTDPSWITITGEQGNEWVQQQVSVDLEGSERILFKGVIGDGFLGDIAIDNVAVSSGACSTDLFTCYFDEGENDVCGMIQEADENFDWTWITHSTPDSGTGPTSAQTPLGYLYTNSGSQSTGHIAKVRTGELGYNGPACVGFWYYMYGEDIGVNGLQLYLHNLGSDELTQVWSKNGNQGQTWLQFRQTVTGLSPNIAIGWSSRVGGVRSQVAIDSVTVMKDECPELSTELPFECDFESAGVCDMTQFNSDDFDWTRKQGYTPTSNTGPADALSGNYYMFIEASVPRTTGDYSIFETPSLNHDGEACVEFYAHMNGQSIGSLVIITSNRTQPWHTITGNKGDHWIRHRIDVEVHHGEKIWFKGVCGNGYFGDIAIDQVEIKAGACPIATDLFACSFDGGENDVCNMIQQTNDQYDWDWITLEIPDPNTGPRGPHSSPGHVFARSFYPRVAGDVARLNTGPLNYYGSVCVEFWYSLFGNGLPVDALELYVLDASDSANNRIVWSRGGNQGTEWLSAAQTVTGVTEDVSIGWKSKVGGTFSQVAIDDIQITEGPCDVVSTTVDFETTRDIVTTVSTTQGPTSAAATTQPPPTVNLPYHCGFEEDESCDITQMDDDDFDWIRTAEGSPTLNTGPAFPHGGFNFMFIESSQPRTQNQMAVLQTPILNYTGVVCIQFYYHMHGANIGVLTMDSNKRAVPMATLTGPQGNEWKVEQVSLTLVSEERLLIGARVGNGYLGDIGIDDISVIQGTCTSSLYACSFDGGENDYCDMRQQSNDVFDWSWAHTVTPGDLTGPDAPQTPPGFIFTNSGPPQEAGMGAKISTPELKHNGPICLEFWYCLYGEDIPQDGLQLFLRNIEEGGTEAIVWTTGGDQGQRWSHYKQTLGISQDISVGWRAHIGGYLSHIAVDSIVIEAGSCPITTTEVVTGTAGFVSPNDTNTTGLADMTTPIIPDYESNLPFACSFEDGNCGMTLRSNNIYDFLLTNLGTSSSTIGPARAADGEYFIYIESDPPMTETQSSIIDTPDLIHYGTVCLEFDYYMWGSYTDYLRVYSQKRGQANPIYGKYGGQSGGWERVRIEVFLNLYEQFYWAASIERGSRGSIAIDHIRIYPGACTEGTPQTTATPTTTEEPFIGISLPLFCGFEISSICGMYQPGEVEMVDQFDWTRQTGATRTANTGPTGAKTGGWYMYIESDPPRKSGEVAILETPAISQRGQSCLRFDAHMSGAHIDTLMVVTPNKGEEFPWFVLEGEQGDSWQSYQTEINIHREKVYFKAIRGVGELGDIAIDNINITNGDCTGVVTPRTTSRATPPTRSPNSGDEVDLPFTCDFENDKICGFKQPGEKDARDYIDWVRYSGKTPSRDTGPPLAYSGSWYMYTETRAQRTIADDAILETPTMRYFGYACVHANVYMSGDDVRTFMVMTSTRGLLEPWEVLVGNLGEQWFQAKVDVYIEYDKVQLRGVRGMGEEGEIAIDFIEIIAGKCGAPITTTRSTPSKPSTTTLSSNFTLTFENVTINTPRQGESTQESDQTYVILLGVLGSVIGFLVIIGILGFVYFKVLSKKQYSNLDDTPADEGMDEEPPPDVYHRPPPAGRPPPAPPAAAAPVPVPPTISPPINPNPAPEQPPAAPRRQSSSSRRKSTFSARVDILRDMPPPLPSNEPTPVESNAHLYKNRNQSPKSNKSNGSSMVPIY